ncbi:subunit 1 of oligomeric Golgi complex [Chloropicon primus]|uniref:Conserved oligomeric Golgi complex subunit 1 n=1 Tax=Chloropicon primus TaxID=1764295 RepID=A0A5B8MBW9_9CHLO|nr:subunit 1 of oligomeric Golgi complex [Chloropicon primus]|eukprot:QDZ17574.1 subunit 1 of oligomeric Golgi complex [Chloropicon primus]
METTGKGGGGVEMGGDGVKSAEHLFEQRPVEEIRGVEKRAREQVDLKREELRQVVGASYREFIDSADGIKACSTAATTAARDVLLDTSESIWAVLEAEKNSQQQQQQTETSRHGSDTEQSRVLSHGARLAARAFVLWQTQGKEVSRKFPLLAKQKVQLVDLCKKLRKACLSRLESARTDRALAVDALAALVLLDVVQAAQKTASSAGSGLQDMASIKSGLSLCSLWLKQRLSAIPKATKSWESLSSVGEIVKDVLCEVESLFVASKQYSKANLASMCLPDVEGDIWYEALPRHEEELKLWRQYLDGFVHTTSPISLKMVSELCSKWVKSAQKESEAITKDHIGSLSELPVLMEAEKRIHGVLDATQKNDLSLDASKDFEAHCLAILRRKVHLWNEFYEASFAERAKSIIKESFSEILPMVKNEVKKVDPSMDLELEYRNKLCRILHSIRVMVSKIFIEMMQFFLLPRDTSVLESRASSLQGFMQECCFDLLKDIGAYLEEVMDKMSSESENLCEYGVFLSNLCDCLQTENSQLFRFLFGKSKEWINAGTSNKKDISAIEMYSLDIEDIHKSKSELLEHLKENSLSSAQSALSSLDYPLKLEMDQKLQSISRNAFGAFVDHVCSSVQKSVESHLENDENLLSSKRDANWEEIVVQHQDEDGNNVDMKFCLPHMPSPFIVDHLFSALGELHKARYVKSNLPNFKVFEEELSRTFMKAFSGFLDKRSKSLGERGVLQLLFDVRFIFDVLAGGNTGLSGSLGSLGSLGLTSAKHSALERRLSGLLDPIDWATYEPYLWKNEVQFYHRCSLLFQDFMSIHKVHGDKEVKTKSSSKSNIMEMSSNVPRFNYLPISTPSVFKAETADDLLEAGFADSSSKQSSQGKMANGGSASDKEKSNMFGSILGEKAAEATAMAQDLFSGAGFFTSLTK